MKKDIFEMAGLAESEAECYRLLLENGELTPPEIAEKMDVSRQNSYIILANLEKKGVIRKDARHNKIRYNPENPEILTQLCTDNIRLLEAYREDIDDAMPELKSLYSLAKDRPGIHVLYGIEGVQKLYTDMLKKHPSELLLILSEQGKNTYLEAWLERKFRPERIAKNIKIREIINTDTKHDPKVLAKLLWKKKYVDMPGMPRNMDIFIYDDNVTFIKYNKKEPYGFTIDDTLVFFAIKAFFETSWKNK